MKVGVFRQLFELKKEKQMTKQIMILATAILIASSVACSTDNTNKQHNSNEDLPHKMPAVVPIFESSTIQSSYTVADDSWRIRLVADATEDEVKDFYERNFSKNGFKLTNDFEDGFSTATGLHLEKSIRVHTVVNKSDYFQGIESGKIVIDLAVSYDIDEDN